MHTSVLFNGDQPTPLGESLIESSANKALDEMPAHLQREMPSPRIDPARTIPPPDLGESPLGNSQRDLARNVIRGLRALEGDEVWVDQTGGAMLASGDIAKTMRALYKSNLKFLNQLRLAGLLDLNDVT